MDFGMQVRCDRCLEEFQMYYDTHEVEEIWSVMAGMCPACNAMVTKMVVGDGLYYPPHELYEQGQRITPVEYRGE